MTKSLEIFIVEIFEQQGQKTNLQFRKIHEAARSAVDCSSEYKSPVYSKKTVDTGKLVSGNYLCGLYYLGVLLHPGNLYTEHLYNDYDAQGPRDQG